MGCLKRWSWQGTDMFKLHQFIPNRHISAQHSCSHQHTLWIRASTPQHSQCLHHQSNYLSTHNLQCPSVKYQTSNSQCTFSTWISQRLTCNKFRMKEKLGIFFRLKTTTQWTRKQWIQWDQTSCRRLQSLIWNRSTSNWKNQEDCSRNDIWENDWIDWCLSHWFYINEFCFVLNWIYIKSSKFMIEG